MGRGGAEGAEVGSLAGGTLSESSMSVGCEVGAGSVLKEGGSLNMEYPSEYTVEMCRGMQ